MIRIRFGSNLARTFEVETVSGNHLDMVTTHFESLATALTRYLSHSIVKHSPSGARRATEELSALCTEPRQSGAFPRFVTTDTALSE